MELPLLLLLLCLPTLLQLWPLRLLLLVLHMPAHAVVAVNTTEPVPNAVAAAVFGLHPVVVMVPRHRCSTAWHVVSCPAPLERSCTAVT